MGADAWWFDGELDDVFNRSWILEDEGVLLGLLAQRVVVNFCRGEHHGVFSVVKLPISGRLDRAYRL